MTGQQWFTKYEGTAILVPGGGAGNNGQCEQAADSYLHEVYGLPYVYTPAAKDWWYKFNSFPQLKDNFDKIERGQPIKAGDFIVYDPLSATDSQGHVDEASKNGTINNFWAYDSNWNAALFHDKNGYPILHEVNHADGFNSKVIGYLRKKTSKPQGGNTMYPNSGDLTNIYKSFGWPNHVPNANDIAYWTKGTNNPVWAKGADAVWKALFYEVMKDKPASAPPANVTKLNPGFYEV